MKASTLTLAQDIMVNGMDKQRETMIFALEGERGVLAWKVVGAHDVAENLHALAIAQPQGEQRDANLVVSSRALSRAADLQRRNTQ